MKIRLSSRRTVEGIAFADYIKTESFSRRRYSNPLDDGKNSIREYLLPILLVIFLGALFFKIVSLQIFQGQYYQKLSDNNRIRTKIIHASRGIVTDRNGVALIFNTPGFRKTVDGKTNLLSREEAMKAIALGKTDLEVDSLRKYPYKEVFAHVLGYVGQISEEELKYSKFAEYKVSDMVGKMGIEKKYEEKLKGMDGKQLIEVNALGKEVRTLGQTDPRPGENVILTLDANLQQKAYEALNDVKKGVVIVSSPQGEILAIVSKPSFDPNIFTMGKLYKADGNSNTSIQSVLSDSSNQPLINRAIAGVYPPGSTFKLITAASGLENKIIDENYQVEDTGVLTLGAFSFANWFYTGHGKTEGSVDVVKAIKRSNDIFFYKLAEKIGVGKLSETAKRFGLGEKTGIDLDGEEEGIVPTNSWKQKVIKEQWYLGDTYHYGIGQGYLLTTPIQVNIWTQAIANKGTIYEPHLLKSKSLKIKAENLIGDKTYGLIQQGMIESCSTGGVAWPLFKLKVQNSKFKIDGKNFLEPSEASESAKTKDIKEISIACKTGTAQHGDEETLPHSWITLFAPAYNPQIIVTVLAESSGEGSSVAAPIAKEVLKEWFNRN